MSQLNYFCFDIGGVTCTQGSTERAIAQGKEYFGDAFSKKYLQQLLFAHLGDGRDYWREFQNGVLPKGEYLEKALLAGKLPVSAENKVKLEDCLKAWCGDPYQPVLDLILRLKQQGHHTSVLTNNNEIMYATPSGRVQSVVDMVTSSHHIGVSKPHEEAYVIHLDHIGAKAEETFFVDDKIANVRAFEGLGGCGFHFRSKEIGMGGAFRELMDFLNEKKVFRP